MTTCIPTGKKYAGRCSCDKRWDEGCLGSGVLLKQSIAKYGRDQFSREVLEELPNATLREAIDTEKSWLLKMNAKKSPDFYNLSENTGGMGKGDKHTDATKEKIKLRMREIYGDVGLPPEWRENVANARKGKTPWNKGKAGLYKKSPASTWKVFLYNEYVQMKNEYEAGASASKLSKKYHCSHHTVLKLVRNGFSS